MRLNGQYTQLTRPAGEGIQEEGMASAKAWPGERDRETGGGGAGVGTQGLKSLVCFLGGAVALGLLGLQVTWQEL